MISTGRKSTSIDAMIGARVRERRLALNMSQERVAESIGVTFQQLQKYEKGVNRISASMLYRIAEVLEIQAKELLPQESGSADEASPASKEVALLVTSYLRIKSQEARDSVLTLVQQLATNSRSKS